MVSIGVRLPRHNGEVHGVVTNDDAVLELRVRRRARHAQARRRRHGVPRVLHLRRLRQFELAASATYVSLLSNRNIKTLDFLSE